MDNRPVNLDLSTVKFPVTAIASITHRVSGVVLLGGILLLLWMLDRSLESEQGFEVIKTLLDNVLVKLILWGVLSALAYHFVAGIRHMVMDLGFWEHLGSGKASAWSMMFIAAILIILAGIWLW